MAQTTMSSSAQALSVRKRADHAGSFGQTEVRDNSASVKDPTQHFICDRLCKIIKTEF
jgi:hypothetical protein